MEGGMTFFQAFYIFALSVSGILMVMWLMLPNAIFKSRDALEEIKKQNEETNRLLKEISDKLASDTATKETSSASNDKDGEDSTTV